MNTAVTLFSGGGCGALGLQAAGYQIVGAVEYDPAIAACYAQNVGPVEVVDLSKMVARFFARWIGVGLLQVSPPCPNFSSAKTNGRETPLDYRLAGAVCRALRVMLPQVFILENVRGYQHSASYARIRHTLAALGYQVQARVVNAADYGVPQTRERLILLAVREGRVRWPRQTHANGGGLGVLPWVGWYAAIADLIPTLPASQFAPWQLERLPAELRDMGVMVDSKNAGQEYGKLHRLGQEPSITVTAIDRPSHMPRAFLASPVDGLCGTAHQPAQTVVSSEKTVMPRAFLLDCQESGSQSGLICRDGESPAFTISAGTGTTRPARAFLMADSKDKFGDGRRDATEPAHTITVTGAAHPLRAWLEQGRVVQLTPRALARFQTIPDSYILPDKASLACRIIGNGVPCLLIQRLAEQLIIHAAQEA